MKTPVSLAVILAASLAAAQPHHHHQHRHFDKRVPDATVVSVAAETIVAYELNGKQISADEVYEGIANGTLKWANGSGPSLASVVSEVTETIAATSTVVSSTAAATTTSASVSSTDLGIAEFFEVSSASSSAASSKSSAASSSSGSASATSSSSSSSATGVDADFPDGEIPCSTFPSAYGAVSLDYLGLDGWSGIQNPTYSDDGDSISDIETLTSGGCDDTYFCSYACPAGYQKSQWPDTQGSSGQSVGGIECKDGYLYLTNSDYSTLCISGTGKTRIKNTLSKQVAVCRTDYPGTESETIPLQVSAGSTEELTCPDEANYYMWEGSYTSAQYYVNPKGYSTEDACQWGSSSEDIGNWAPVNIGVGTQDGATWISILQNSPTTDAKLDFDIVISGDLSGVCSYDHSSGEYCTGDDFTDCNSSGCTVEVMSGVATYTFQ